MASAIEAHSTRNSDDIVRHSQKCESRLTTCITVMDEVVIVCKDHPKAIKAISDIISESIVEISRDWKLRRELGCDVQFGKRYSEIH